MRSSFSASGVTNCNTELITGPSVASPTITCRCLPRTCGEGERAVTTREREIRERARPHHRRVVERARPVERLDGVIAVADPAVAIIPVALAVRGFGDRGGQRGDDGAGFLVLAQLQRDRGADHLVLPFERKREISAPLTPVIGGLLEKFAGDTTCTFGQRLVGAEDDAARPIEQEIGFFENVRYRQVGGAAHRAARGQVTDMVRPPCRLDAAGAPVTRGTQPDADARTARDRPHGADEHIRSERTAELFEAGREIRDFDRIAVAVVHGGHDDRGVRDI